MENQMVPAQYPHGEPGSSRHSISECMRPERMKTSALSAYLAKRLPRGTCSRFLEMMEACALKERRISWCQKPDQKPRSEEAAERLPNKGGHSAGVSRPVATAATANMS